MTWPEVASLRAEGFCVSSTFRAAQSPISAGAVCEARSWGAAKAGAEATLGTNEASVRAAVARISAVAKSAAEWMGERGMAKPILLESDLMYRFARFPVLAESMMAIEVYPVATLVAHRLRSKRYEARNRIKQRSELISHGRQTRTAKQPAMRMVPPTV